MSKKLFCLVLSLSISISLFSEEDTSRQTMLDSLSNAVAQAEHDTLKIDPLLDLAWEYMNNNPEKAKDYVQQAFELSEKYNSNQGLLLSHFYIGVIHYNQAEYELALENYLKGIELSKKSTIHSKQLSQFYNNIGNVYVSLDNLELAVDYYEKSVEIKEELGDYISLIPSMLNLGALKYKMDDLSNAIKEIEHAYQLSQKYDYDRYYGTIFGNLGFMYKQEEEYDLALKYYQKAVDFKRKNDDQNGLITTNMNLSSLYIFLKEYDKAKTIIDESMEIAQRNNFKSKEKDLYNSYASLYHAQGDYLNAFEYMKMFAAKSQELYSEESADRIAKMQAEFNDEQQKKKIELLNTEKELSNEKLARQNTMINAFIGGGVLFVLLLLTVYNRYRVKKLSGEKLEKAYKNIEVKNKEITDSIVYAKRIQDTILPSNSFIDENLKDTFVLFKPKDVVSGDFYWMECSAGSMQNAVGKEEQVVTDGNSSSGLPLGKLEGATTFLAAADCTGHGVPGAMVSVVCATALSKVVQEEHITAPGQILDRTRELVVERFKRSQEDVKDGMDISLAALAHSTKSEHGEQKALLQWSGANNPLWIVSKREQVYDGCSRVLTGETCFLHEVTADKQPIGKVDDPKDFKTHTIELKPGDTFYLFSDGFHDQFGGDKAKKFKTSNFKKLLLSIHDRSMTEQKTLLDEAFENWKGELEQVDDVCVIGVRISAL